MPRQMATIPNGVVQQAGVFSLGFMIGFKTKYIPAVRRASPVTSCFNLKCSLESGNFPLVSDMSLGLILILSGDIGDALYYKLSKNETKNRLEKRMTLVSGGFCLL
jgi:hypothetical protein